MSQRKLLLADDSVTIQKVVNLTFADEGIDVLTVGDGDSAMEQMAAFKPDLIMADVNMPGLNGYQICEQIKQSEGFSNTPVILLVGSFEPFDESEAQRVGADDFLTKPFQSIRQLVTKVTELLDANKDTAEFPVTVDAENSAQISEESNSENYSSGNYSDSVIDDEMVQTSQPSGFIFDESSKFKTREADEPAEDYAKTRPFSEEEIREFSFSETEKLPETFEEVETEKSEEPVVQDLQTETNFSEPPVTTAGFDEDILELPPNEVYEEDYAEEREFEVGDGNSEKAESPGEVLVQDQNAQSFVASSQLSPETIDIIVQKVIEKLSDKAVKEVAWEVVPQMADLIIKKMAAEKFKD